MAAALFVALFGQATSGSPSSAGSGHSAIVPLERSGHTLINRQRDRLALLLRLSQVTGI